MAAMVTIMSCDVMLTAMGSYIASCNMGLEHCSIRHIITGYIDIFDQINVLNGPNTDELIVRVQVCRR